MSQTATTPAPALPTGTPAELVERYIALRDGRKVSDETFAAWRKEHFDMEMDALENAMLDTLNKLGVDSIKAPSGTVYKKLTTSVTVGDQREFRRHVIGDEAWDLIDWRANKTAVNDLIENGGELPPGINRNAFYTVGVRRSS